MAQKLRFGIIGMSEGNGHPYSWAAIFNGFNKHKMAFCPFKSIPEYLQKENYPDDFLSNYGEVTHIWTQEPEISKQIYYHNTLNVFINKYSQIGPQWTIHQSEWMNDTYKFFKDHDKFLIVIHLIRKTLDFYSKTFTKLSYDEFHSINTVEIEKFNVSDISKSLNIPKESARRKIVELEESLVIKREKKRIILDRSSFPFVKPINSVKRISRFLSIFSKILVKEKILKNKLSSEELENVIKKNFSLVWKAYYELQIPMMVRYKGIFKDLETFHIYGTCIVNQHLYLQKNIQKKMTRSEFIKSIYSGKETQGLNAMSIADITSIPRATVVRKLNQLVKKKYLLINSKKHYKVSGALVKKLIPIQNKTFLQLSQFSSLIFNLAIL